MRVPDKSLRVSEKSLELNIGSEFLVYMRETLGLTKAHLRGLTQREERAEGADFVLQLNPKATIFAFQFKAPVAHRPNREDSAPYRFTLQREQHESLVDLAGKSPAAVYYVFPFFARPAKLRDFVPNLLHDTWLLPVSTMMKDDIFGAQKTKRIRCYPGRAEINPVYVLENAAETVFTKADGIQIGNFNSWYQRLRGRLNGGEQPPKEIERRPHEDDGDAVVSNEGYELPSGTVSHGATEGPTFRSPQLVRGMRIAIVE